MLEAGLKPRLENRFRVRYQRRADSGLSDALRVSISSKLQPDKTKTAWWLLEQKLRERGGAERPLVVILDQVEEVFTRPGATGSTELAEFVELVRSIFVNIRRRPQGKLILGFRKEWLAEISKALRARHVPFSSLFLDRLNARGVVEAVELSSDARRHFGLTVEPALPKRIATELLADTASPAAPTLQILLAGMWDSVSGNPEDKTFSESLYAQTVRGGLKLDHFVSEKMEGLAAAQPSISDSGLGLDILNFHTTELGTAAARTESELQLAYSNHWRDVTTFLQNCQNSYLLIDATSENETGQGERTSL